MNAKLKKSKIIAMLLVLVVCMIVPMQSASAMPEDDWAAVEDTFTLDAVSQYFPDDGFAAAVYDSISAAIQNGDYHMDKVNILDDEGYSDLWPEPMTIEEMIEEGLTGNDLVLKILSDYAGPIGAYSRGITDITGYRYLKNTTSIDFQRNKITDLSSFTGDPPIAGSYNFNANPICKWPVTFPNTIRASTHSVATSFTVNTAPICYLFGETVTPTMKYNVYYNGAINTKWHYGGLTGWDNTTAYGTTTPPLPTVDGTTEVTLPPINGQGSASLFISLTGSKTGTLPNKSNAITYISGMDVNGHGGTPGQGNSPSYRFGVQVQRYAKVTIEDETTISGGFVFEKKSASTQEPVAGAEYTLYNEEECLTVAGGPFVTDENGLIKEVGFEPGEYFLKETKAPAGYKLNETPVSIVISDPGGANVSVNGGVSKFDHDDVNPDLSAVFGNLNATNGEWKKLTDTTTETKTTVGADALLTNKGNIGWANLTSLSGETQSNNDKYEQKDIEIIVSVGGEEYGRYASDAEALAGINNMVKLKEVTGDITISYGCVFEEKLGMYSGVGEQEDEQDETTPYSLKITKNNEDGDLLKGSGFKVYLDPECTVLAAVYSDSEMLNLIEDTEDSVLRTGDDGVLRFYGLETEKTYYIKEVYAPSGYGLKLPIKIAVDADGGVLVNDTYDKTPEEGTTEISITVTDTVLALDLPVTGFGGTIQFLVTGILASGIIVTISTFVIVAILNKKRRKME